MPRYDLPKAAPEPLRRVQLFLNSIDLSHGREWIADWLEEQHVRPTPVAMRRAQEVREALRELLYANNRQPGKLDPYRILERAADAARLSLDLRGPAIVPRAAGIDGAARPRARRRLHGNAGRDVRPPEGVPQPRLPLGLLRLLEEPLGELVLDAALREPDEDSRVSAPALGRERVSSPAWRPAREPAAVPSALHRDRPEACPTLYERRLADSNRRTRLCRPLPNHSAKAPDGRMVSAAARRYGCETVSVKEPEPFTRLT